MKFCRGARPTKTSLFSPAVSTRSGSGCARRGSSPTWPRSSSTPSTKCGAALITCSRPAASGQPTTTSPRNASPTRLACRWSCIPTPRLLETHYLPGQLNAARLRMAMVPQGAALLPNPISRAPGFQIGNVYVLPGVPNIMRGIFEQLKYRLAGGDKVLSRSVSCALGEGTLAADLAALQERWPDIEIGSYPYFRRGDFGVTLVLRGTDRERLAAATEAVTALIRALGGEPQEGLGEG